MKSLLYMWRFRCNDALKCAVFPFKMHIVYSRTETFHKTIILFVLVYFYIEPMFLLFLRYSESQVLYQNGPYTYERESDKSKKCLFVSYLLTGF